ncbi:hypothetical protein THAOC_37570, partial [Thalassiosira oceanica]
MPKPSRKVCWEAKSQKWVGGSPQYTTLTWRALLAAPTMITGPDRNCRYRIVSAFSRPSCRAAGGLRRTSESRAFPTSKPTIYLMMCAGRGDQRSSDIESPRLDGVRKIRRQGLKPPESGDLSPPTRVDEDGFLRCRLAVGTILAVEVGIVRTV